MQLAEKRAEWRKATKRMGLSKKSKIDALPSNMIGRSVENKFMATWHVGHIVNCDIDVATMEPIWRVQYDDGDSADYNEKEVKAILVDKEDTLETAARRLQRPQILIGSSFQKSFRGEPHFGIITNHDEDSATGDIIWGVQFEDGDKGDYNLQEITNGLDHNQEKRLGPRQHN
jgi:hypothetical protein